MIFHYSPALAPMVIGTKPAPVASAGGSDKPKTSPPPAQTKPEEIIESTIAVPVGNLQASALESDTISDSNDSSNSYLPMIISFIFIGVSAVAVYFFRRSKTPAEAGDDFKILGE